MTTGGWGESGGVVSREGGEPEHSLDIKKKPMKQDKTRTASEKTMRNNKKKQGHAGTRHAKLTKTSRRVYSEGGYYPPP